MIFLQTGLPLGAFSLSCQAESSPPNRLLFPYQSLVACPEIAQLGSCCIYCLS